MINDLPLYAVVDRRSDGRVRILQQFKEARDAVDACRALRWAGDDNADVVLISASRDEAHA